MFKKLSKTEYKDLFDKASFKTFFHNPEWHEFLEKEFKWIKFEYYQYKNEAFLPLARFKVSGTEKLVSLPFCEYGGPLPLKGDINWEDFSKDVFNEFGNNIKIKIWPNVSSISGNPPGASSSSSYWLRNLENETEESIWNSFRKTLRHEIEHAQEHNLEIKKSSNEQELKQFYSLYVTNLRRKKTIPYPWPLIQFLCKNPSNELSLATHKGKVIAGCLFLNYSGFVHYFLSASDYRYRNLGANYLIIWEKIKSLIASGSTESKVRRKQDKILDLGASPQGSNLEIFKRGWGGTEYPIYQIGAKKSPAHAKASADREESLRLSKLRNIWGLLPRFVIKKMSRYLIKYRI